MTKYINHLIIAGVLVCAGGASQTFAQSNNAAAYCQSEIQRLEIGNQQFRNEIAEQENLIAEYQRAMEPLNTNDFAGAQERNAERQRAIAAVSQRIEQLEGDIEDNNRAIERYIFQCSR